MACIFNTFTTGANIWAPTKAELETLDKKSGLQKAKPLYLNPKMWSLSKEQQVFALLIFLIRNNGGGQYTLLKYLKTGVLPVVRQSQVNLCVYKFCETNFSMPEKLFFAEIYDNFLRSMEYAIQHEPMNIPQIKDGIVSYYQRMIMY
jgi:hypothetical protein